MRDIDFTVLFELMKNAKMSDRELARKIGVSQPTITRRRTVLEKEAIDGYTAIPKWTKIGYEILAITLIKAMGVFTSKKYSLQEIRKLGSEWLAKQHNVIMGGTCEGMGMDSVIISLHKNYSDYSKFMFKLRNEMGRFMDDVQTILIDLNGSERMLKPFHLKYLANTK